MDTYFEYHVKRGDTLSAIIFKMFGYTPSDSRYAGTLAHIMSLNPHVRNPDKIVAGDMLRLDVIPQAKVVARPTPVIRPPAIISAPKNEPFITKNVAQEDIANYWALSWLEHNSNYLTVPGGVAVGATGNLMNAGNIGLIREIGDLYAEYKRGNITKGQYGYRRASVLTKFKGRVGPMEKILFGNKTTHQSVRIARGGGLPATAHITRNVNKLNMLAILSKAGGIVLVGVGVTASCMQIAGTENREEKNEVFVETVAGTITGIVAGVAVGLFLVSNPVGWGAALVLATGSTAMSYGVGKTARYAYDKFGNKVDFVSGAGVDRICQ